MSDRRSVEGPPSSEEGDVEREVPGRPDPGDEVAHPDTPPPPD